MESGEFAAAEGLLAEAIETATLLGDERLAADAVLSRLLVRHHAANDLRAWCEEVERETKRLIPLLEALHADAELAKAWRLVAFVHGSVCQFEQAAAATQHALEYARRAGRPRLEARLSAALTHALRDGPTPVPEAIVRCEAIIEAGLVDQQAEVQATVHLAYLHGLAGDLAAARRLCQQARARLADLGGGALSASAQVSLTNSRVELLAEQPANAEPELRLHFDALGDIGERYLRPGVGALLAQLIYSNGKSEEALVLTSEVEEMAAADDVEVQALWRSVRGKVLARDGQVDAAVRLTRDAVRVLQTTDAPVMKGDTFLDQAIVFMSAGRNDEAAVALRRARELYLRKRATYPLHRVDALLAGIDALLGANLPAGPARQPAASGRRIRPKPQASAARSA